jgi:hypothetical protein
MSNKIAWARLHCQRLAAGRLARPEDVVGRLGAVQAQEYPFAKWGLALRTRRASDASVERAFAAGSILRTHVMRATWHFVTPVDIRWLLALTAPRVPAAVAFYDRQLGITPAVITRANRAIARALAGGAQLTRVPQRLQGPERVARPHTLEVRCGTRPYDAPVVLDGRVVGGWRRAAHR